MHYEFYIDVYIVTNFFFDYLTLFLIREVRRKQTKTGRMAVMALLGVLSAAASMLLLKNRAVPLQFQILMTGFLIFYSSIKKIYLHSRVILCRGLLKSAAR